MPLPVKTKCSSSETSLHSFLIISNVPSQMCKSYSSVSVATRCNFYRKDGQWRLKVAVAKKNIVLQLWTCITFLTFKDVHY